MDHMYGHIYCCSVVMRADVHLTAWSSGALLPNDKL